MTYNQEHDLYFHNTSQWANQVVSQPVVIVSSIMNDISYCLHEEVSFDESLSPSIGNAVDEVSCLGKQREVKNFFKYSGMYGKTLIYLPKFRLILLFHGEIGLLSNWFV